MKITVERKRKLGPGLFEFLEQGNVVPYYPSHMSMNVLMEQIKEFWFDRLPSPRDKAIDKITRSIRRE